MYICHQVIKATEIINKLQDKLLGSSAENFPVTYRKLKVFYKTFSIISLGFLLFCIKWTCFLLRLKKILLFVNGFL